MRVEIVSCSGKGYWYKDYIGEKFEVCLDYINDKYYVIEVIAGYENYKCSIEKSDIRIVRDDRIISNDIILERATFRGEDLYLLSNCDTLESMILPVKDTKKIYRGILNEIME